MKKFVLTVAMLLCICRPSFADEASKRAKIEELFTLIHLQQALDQIADQQAAQVKKMLPSLIPEQNLSDTDHKNIDTFTDRLTVMVRESINWEKLKPQYVDLYAATYDEPTIDGIVAFYKSDAGRTMVAKQPELIEKSQSITQARLTELQPKMRAMFEDFMLQMQKKPAPAGASPRSMLPVPAPK